MMRRALSIVFILAAASMAAAQSASTTSTEKPAQTPAQPKATPMAPHTSLKVGQAAPDFTLPSSISGPDGRKIRYTLSDFKGKKNVVLAFYVFAFTGG
jgi:hypothetical protein